ncbi:uncharacterized protein JN550_013581 [Neoarthrinium moseri]|uniref:uncharacterized protein n=1 Tax=Neoarthrinium moseri TaxID=1658444 RepID=UPI001FDD9187|nr:uncharacterized protein JN550_013581 [Neoarthrinium moseri]KAI1856911.1 hypothetical protein JN550_013581 [Neoarthrinium moseri]
MSSRAVFRTSILIVALMFLVATTTHATIITNDTAHLADGRFDYIIVGAGLTGITVANKLSAANHSVLLIEAGPDPSWNPAVYNAEERGDLNGYCNWRYPAYNESGVRLDWEIDSGKCVGGGTSINGMVWYRPTEIEVNKLQDLGNPGWNWAALEPYMQAIEKFHPPDETQSQQGAGYDPDVHGYVGVVNVSFPTPMRIPKAQVIYKQALPIVFPGLTVGNDLSNRSSIVSASSSWTIWYDPVSGNNRRSSAANALLSAPDQKRASFVVLTDHKVDKVVLNSSLRATGVTFASSPTGETSTAYVSREVILAAGSLGTPPILERSGIGRGDILERAGVSQLVDLPGVGANLNDQPGTGTSALVRKDLWNDTGLIDGRNLFAPEISLVNVDELWAAVNAGSAATLEGAQRVLNTSIDLILNSRLPVGEFVAESYPTILFAAFWPSMPLSRGHIHINASDPFSDPIITPRLLTDSFDQAVGVALAKRSRDLFSSMPFAEVVQDSYYDPHIGVNGTDEEYLAWYKSTTFGASHWIGSTAMMKREWGGVVDAKLRVYGVRGLRVVDAGTLPFQITSHPMAMLYAIAQRAADIIMGNI